MPASPEVDDIGSLVGRIEIERQAHTDEKRQSDGHIGIGREIEIELQRIGKRARPCVIEKRCFARMKHNAHRFDKAVGNQHFLSEPDGEDREARGDHRRIRAECFRPSELRHHRLMMDNRSGQQMRKIGDEQSIIDKASRPRTLMCFHFTARGINQISDLREGEKRNAERQHDMHQVPLRAEHEVGVGNEEIGIFIIPKQRQITGNAQRQDRPCRAGPYSRPRHADAGTDSEIEKDRTADQPEIIRRPSGIKIKRGEHEPRPRRHRPKAAKREEHENRDRQKAENKTIRIKKHCPPAFPIAPKGPASPHRHQTHHQGCPRPDPAAFSQNAAHRLRPALLPASRCSYYSENIGMEI